MEREEGPWHEHSIKVSTEKHARSILSHPQEGALRMEDVSGACF